MGSRASEALLDADRAAGGARHGFVEDVRSGCAATSGRTHHRPKWAARSTSPVHIRRPTDEASCSSVRTSRRTSASVIPSRNVRRRRPSAPAGVRVATRNGPSQTTTTRSITAEITLR